MNGIVATCTNDADSGGLYVCSLPDLTTRRVYDRQCMGVAVYDNCYVLASQASIRHGSSRQELTASLGRAPHALVCLDSSFRVLSEAGLDHLGMGDLHDVLIHERELFVVDTLSNRVVAFSIQARWTPGCLPLGMNYVQPMREWVDPMAVEPDASHVNSICLFRGRLYATVFGRFEIHRGYERRSIEDGAVLDITDGFRPWNSRWTIPDPIVVRTGLADPHTLVSHQDSLYVIESRRRRVLKDWSPMVALSSGYVRGLLHDDGGVWIGRSQSRHSPAELDGCAVMLFSNDCESVRCRFDLPAREVYAFVKLIDLERS